jgi:hypothetical protein
MAVLLLIGSTRDIAALLLPADAQIVAFCDDAVQVRRTGKNGKRVQDQA